MTGDIFDLKLNNYKLIGEKNKFISKKKYIIKIYMVSL